MAETLLNQVLSSLHRSDQQIWSRLSGLSGQLSTAFSADNKIAIGTANGLSASNYSFGDAIAEGNLDNVIVDAEAISSFVQDKVDTLANEQGTALTGVTVTGAVKKLDAEDHKSVTIGLDVDGTTISQVDGKLSSVITLTKLGTAAEGYAATYQLQDNAGHQIGAEINIPKDQFLSAAVYNASTESIDLTFAINGEPSQASIPVSGLVHEFEGVSGVAIDFKSGDSPSQIKAVIDSTHNDGKYLTLNENGIGLSGIEDYVTGQVATAQSNANAGLTTLSAALTDYLGENAVSGKFAEVVADINAINTKLGTDLGDTNNAGKVLVTDASGNIDASAAVLGSDSQLSTDFGGTDVNNTLATEKATKNYVDGAIAANSSDLTTGLSGDNQFVLTDGDKKLATTGLTLDTDMLDGANLATTIPTTLAVQNYIEEGLSDLSGQINTLLTLMGGSND